MWIASKYGFYSIVKKEGAWHVRGRLENDLINLARACDLEIDRIENWPDADYRWRIRVDAADLGRVFAALEESIDYPNFKSLVHASPDQAEKMSAYSELWTGLARLQWNDPCKPLARTFQKR